MTNNGSNFLEPIKKPIYTEREGNTTMGIGLSKSNSVSLLMKGGTNIFKNNGAKV